MDPTGWGYGEKAATGPKRGSSSRRINGRGTAGSRAISSISYARNELAHRAELAIRGSAELPSHGLLVAKHRASGSRFSDQSVLLVGYFALHIAHRAAALHDPSPAASRASHTGRKKLIFSSTVVKDSSGQECLRMPFPSRRPQCRTESRLVAAPWDLHAARLRRWP